MVVDEPPADSGAAGQRGDRQWLPGLEQRLFELGDLGAGRAGVDARAVEVGERVVAEELAEAPAEGGELGAQPVVGGLGVGEVGAQRRGGDPGGRGSRRGVTVRRLGGAPFGFGA